MFNSNKAQTEFSNQKFNGVLNKDSTNHKKMQRPNQKIVVRNQ